MFHHVVSQIESLLKDNNCWYEKFEHAPVRTSEEAASVRTGYGLEQGAKALIVKTKKNGDVSFVMVVVPGDKRFDSKKVKSVLNVKGVSFASIEEVSSITNGVEVGGVPPFGNLFGLKVLADHSFFNLETIIFNAGDRSVSIAMKWSDYQILVKPTLVSIIG